MEMEYLLRLGELTLKTGRSRERFESRLVDNIRDALESNGFREYEVSVSPGRIYVKVDGDAMGVLTRVFGIVGVVRVISHRFESLDDIVEKGVEIYRELVRGRSFGVRARRVGRHSFRSIDVNRALGEALLKYAEKVDLTNPDIWVRLEIRGDKVYYYLEEGEGPGGLPIGTGGSALALFSGGFDSPVATWLAMRRGIEMHMIHFQLGGERHFNKVLRVAIQLARDWAYGYKPILYRVDFRDVAREIRSRVRQDYRIVILKRLMYRAAEMLLKMIGGEALVTGESIGQVSSQTLRNLVVTDMAIGSTVLRPLVGMDKDEVIGMSRRIGLYDVSRVVEEVCALVEEAPVTWADPEIAAEEEAKIPMELVEEAVSNAMKYSLRDLYNVNLDIPDEYGVEPGEIPRDALVIDIRGSFSYMLGHIPGSINMKPEEVLNRWREFKEEGRPVVLVCPVGLESIELVEKLREKGVEAYYLLGGYRAYKLMERRVGSGAGKSHN